MDIIGVYIGVYIGVHITTTATTTGITITITTTITAACIITIIAIGETYRVVAVSNSFPQGKGRSTRCGLFPFPTPA
jgi:hypothetical protein